MQRHKQEQSKDNYFVVHSLKIYEGNTPNILAKNREDSKLFPKYI
jgi:hypothetical protein